MYLYAKFDVSNCKWRGGGRWWPDIRIPRPRFPYSLYNFRGATMMIQGSYRRAIPSVKAFLADFWPKIWLGHVTCE